MNFGDKFVNGQGSKSCFSIVLQSRRFLSLRNAFKNRAFEATKALLLKHYYRRQGKFPPPQGLLIVSFLEALREP